MENRTRAQFNQRGGRRDRAAMSRFSGQGRSTGGGYGRGRGSYYSGAAESSSGGSGHDEGGEEWNWRSHGGGGGSWRGYGRGRGRSEAGSSSGGGGGSGNYEFDSSRGGSGQGRMSYGSGSSRSSGYGGGFSRGYGGGGGRGGSPPKFHYVPVGSRISDPSGSKSQSIDNSQSIGQSSLPAGTEILACKRPDSGGKSAVRIVNLYVNHFPVKFDAQLTILHYDIVVKPVVQAKQWGNTEISKSVVSVIKNKLFSMNREQFPLLKTAYDGEKNIFSAAELPEGTYPVELSTGKGCNTCYTCTIKLLNKLPLDKLEAYLNGNRTSIPRETLQGMDLVMKQNQDRLRIGRSFYSLEYNPYDDLGNGIIASKGFQHSLKITAQGLVLCVDYSVLPFIKPVPVLEYLKENLQIDCHSGRHLDYKQKRKIEEALKDLRVRVTHRKTKQKFTILRLTKENTNDIEFPLDDAEDKNQAKKVRLVDYFEDRYKPIRYRNLPSLDFSKNGKMNYVPMEFCELIEGQRYPKEELKDEAAKHFRRICLAEPRERMEMICTMVQAKDGPRGGNVAENFNISVSTRMTEVSGRIMKPPDLRLGDANGKSTKFTIHKEDCQWNLVDKSLLQGKAIERWALLDLNERLSPRLNRDVFVRRLRARCSKLGISMNEPVIKETVNMGMLSNSDALRDLLRSINSRTERLQLLICVMTKKDPGYKNLKWISETEIGILTQCCLVRYANECRDQYLSNLALKINAKLGGSNVELFDGLPHFKGDGHVMFIGADVNHPPPRNTTCRSIAAVVATMNWPAANQYAARISPQAHRKEEIQNFGEICLELIHTYARLNNVKPEKIVIFRDGVSDSQFLMVLSKELMDLKKALEPDGYSPTITVVVAQKRHQTRLFPKEGRRQANIAPGTVVDQTIVHPHDFDFYLCSHYGSLGTSKPCHYTVIYDEHGFSSDEMQRLIYNLCYTFARCTKPVSLVPPVYYADLVAYRGRLYHEALNGSNSPVSTVSSVSASSSTLSTLSIASSYHDGAFKLHSNLENAMFFC